MVAHVAPAQNAKGPAFVVRPPARTEAVNRADSVRVQHLRTAAQHVRSTSVPSPATPDSPNRAAHAWRLAATKERLAAQTAPLAKVRWSAMPQPIDARSAAATPSAPHAVMVTASEACNATRTRSDARIAAVPVACVARAIRLVRVASPAARIAGALEYESGSYRRRSQWHSAAAFSLRIWQNGHTRLGFRLNRFRSSFCLTQSQRRRLPRARRFSPPTR